jgi:hypothetical protein
MKLIVVHPFGGYAKGQEITDAAEMAKVMKSNPHAIVQVTTDAKTASISKPSAATTSTNASTKSSN